MPIHPLCLSRLLRRTLFLSPALVLLHACGEQDAESSHSNRPEAPATLAAGQEPPHPASPRKPESSAPLPADLQELVALLTPSNAPRFRDQLRADPARWATCVSLYYREWAKLDPAEALRAAHEEGSLSLSATLGTIEGWTGQDPLQAREFVTQESNPTLRRRLAIPLIKAWPTGDLSSLANWSVHDPSLLAPVALRWSRSDPAAAARWLGELTPGPHQMRTTETLFRQWATIDPEAAGNYLIARRHFSHRDGAIAAYASAVSEDDPLSARDWAQEISDAALRERTIRDLASLQNSSGTTLSGPP